MDYVIDIQGFRDEDRQFLPKEVAVVAMENSYFAHWMIEPPVPFGELHARDQTTNNFVTCYLHGIDWFEGDVSLKRLRINLREIARSAYRILTRGHEKAKYLEQVMARKVVNLELSGCPRFGTLEPAQEYCFFHGAKKEELFTCALNNVVRIKKWLTINKVLSSYDHLARARTISSNIVETSQSKIPAVHSSKCREVERPHSSQTRQQEYPTLSKKVQEQQPPPLPERNSSLRVSPSKPPRISQAIPKKLEYPEESGATATPLEICIPDSPQPLNSSDSFRLYSSPVCSPTDTVISVGVDHGQSSDSQVDTYIRSGYERGFRIRPDPRGLDKPDIYYLKHR